MPKRDHAPGNDPVHGQDTPAHFPRLQQYLCWLEQRVKELYADHGKPLTPKPGRAGHEEPDGEVSTQDHLPPPSPPPRTAGWGC